MALGVFILFPPDNEQVALVLGGPVRALVKVLW